MSDEINANEDFEADQAVQPEEAGIPETETAGGCAGDSGDGGNGEEAEHAETAAEPIPEKYQKMIGKVAAEVRAKERERWEKYLSTLPGAQQHIPQQQYAVQQGIPEGAVFDPELEEYVDADSPEGRIALRNQRLAEKQKMRQQQEQQQKSQAAMHALGQKLDEGYIKYKNYDDSIRVFGENATPVMLEALQGVDEPQDVVAYFTDKKSELARISKLHPYRQIHEIMAAAERAKGKPKLTSSAPAPLSGGKNPSNPSSRYASNRDDNADVEDLVKKYRGY